MTTNASEQAELSPATPMTPEEEFLEDIRISIREIRAGKVVDFWQTVHNLREESDYTEA